METKKCPFCAEEVLADAIKCKHCGERFDTVQFQGATFIQENKNKKLINQDFNKVKLYFGYYVVFYLISSILSLFLKTYFLGEIISTYFWVWLMLFLRTYLQNFHKNKFNSLLSSLIIIYVILQIITTLTERFGEQDLIVAVAIILLISWLIIFIIIGMKMKKLASFDFIGKMKQLGNSFIIFIPISLVLTLIGTALKENDLLLELSYFLLLIGFITEIYPFVIMVQMFMLAFEHQESETVTSEEVIEKNTLQNLNNLENIKSVMNKPKKKQYIIIASVTIVLIIIVGSIIYFHNNNQNLKEDENFSNFVNQTEHYQKIDNNSPLLSSLISHNQVGELKIGMNIPTSMSFLKAYEVDTISGQEVFRIRYKGEKMLELYYDNNSLSQIIVYSEHFKTTNNIKVGMRFSDVNPPIEVQQVELGEEIIPFIKISKGIKAEENFEDFIAENKKHENGTITNITIFKNE